MTAATPSKLALGTWAFAGNAGFWTDQERGDSLKTIHAAVRGGVTAFDTAYAYGNGAAEAMLGQQLKRLGVERGRLTLSTKTTGRDNLAATLRRMLTPYLDVWYLHWPSSRRDVRPILERMAGHPEVRTVGICNATPRYLETLDGTPVRALQAPCSLLWTRNLRETVAYAQEHRWFLSGYSPTGMGVLSGTHDGPPDDARKELYCYRHPAELQALLAAMRAMAAAHGASMSRIALAWARAQGFDQIVLGARTRAQLEDDLAPLVLETDERTELTVLADRLSAKAPAWQDNIFGHRW